ncbi:MAG: HPP family protein [Gammaproteobacteria bacterium]|nr:HPP family protein [Gammaproteobacteria bacterium]
MKYKFYNFVNALGYNKTHSSHNEKIVSGIGGFLGIFLILYITGNFIHLENAVLIVASMGASAVLVFAAPHSPFSQPWSVGFGHLFSATVGVLCYQYTPDIQLAAALSVGLSIVVMLYLHCIHPPGGATALSAVIGGPAVHDLGYQFIITPVLVNVLAILITATAFNNLFRRRPYPFALSHSRKGKRLNQRRGSD